MKNINLSSYAKLNLYLDILGKLPDNYHSVLTLFERISLSDQISFKLLPYSGIRLALSGFDLPRGRNNLAYQAASLLKRDFQIRQGVQISIKKNIPVSAGLGGGSSNAAAVLIGLNELWKLNLKLKQLVALARQIGSDVPFFLYNSSFAFATSRGDEIKVLKSPVKLWHIIVVPRIKILSSSVYKAWDRRHNLPRRHHTGLTQPFQQSSLGIERERAGLTNRQSIIKILKSALLKKDLSSLSEFLFNSLEEVSMAMYPVISKVKSLLSNLGLEAILMSGSGPSVFGLVSSRKEAYAVARRLKTKLGNWDAFVAKTV
jgi:4-diphosphocytidyl-2-C-methyl-D-erythritol kinase